MLDALEQLKLQVHEAIVQLQQETWFQVITFKRIWEQSLDQWRFEEAFMYLAQTCEWFPAPKHLLEAMPPRRMKALPEPQISDEQMAKNSARLSELLKQLRRGRYAK